MFYTGHWSGYLVINRPSWNKGFRGSHDITLNIPLYTSVNTYLKWTCFVIGLLEQKWSVFVTRSIQNDSIVVLYNQPGRL